ncbi:MAG: zinc ribbon domain-containing protein [Verrucomicrobia bacterium]|nr:zinc ribbon domain-containing protein [Verrucomicrobiota bacterium]MBV9299519.1 zinc ribbon domain-containing protein [Verrucomicrobiota bacterium]MBV9644145.1 zinc ribbon domain-containing protein [Verrucomicrobiota bacterium]
MPLYEYLCKKCGESFALTMTISEHGKKRVQCPHCKGTEVEQQVQSFFAKTSRKS